MLQDGGRLEQANRQQGGARIQTVRRVRATDGRRGPGCDDSGDGQRLRSQANPSESCCRETLLWPHDSGAAWRQSDKGVRLESRLPIDGIRPWLRDIVAYSASVTWKHCPLYRDSLPRLMAMPVVTVFSKQSLIQTKLLKCSACNDTSIGIIDNVNVSISCWYQ